MCRLFGVISNVDLNPSDYLLRAPQSLYQLSHVDKKRKQGDGWGVGWFEKGHPQLLKSPRPLYRDRSRWMQAAKQAQGKVLVGHVRWASNPLKLPRTELIGLPHTQPFTHGPWLFAHNGTLYIPREVQAELGSLSQYVKGKNDSEVLFYWLLKTVVPSAASGRWKNAIRTSFRRLNAIWSRCRSSYPIYKYPYHGVNWVLTNGRMLLAFCYVDPRGFDKAKSLGHRHQPYYQLQVQHTGNTIAVASEPLTREPHWRPMGHGSLLIARLDGNNLSVKTVRVL